METIYWLFLVVLFLVVEVMTMGLTTIWCAGGALIAFICGMLGLPLPWQIGVFVAVSILLMVATRPLAIRFLNSRTTRTNADSLIGRTALVTETINNLRALGTVQIDGMTWRARSEDDNTVIQKGDQVIIRKIQGVKLIVTAADKSSGEGQTTN